LLSFEEFCEQLNREEVKLSSLESTTSSSKTLVASNCKGKGKSKTKSKPASTPIQSSSNDSKSKDPSKKKEKSNATCTYRKNNGHSANKCWKKLQGLEESMKKHEIDTPKEHGKALNVQGRSPKSCSHTCVLDSRVTNHMTSSKESYASLLVPHLPLRLEIHPSFLFKEKEILWLMVVASIMFFMCPTFQQIFFLSIMYALQAHGKLYCSQLMEQKFEV